PRLSVAGLSVPRLPVPRLLLRLLTVSGDREPTRDREPAGSLLRLLRLLPGLLPRLLLRLLTREPGDLREPLRELREAGDHPRLLTGLLLRLLTGLVRVRGLLREGGGADGGEEQRGCKGNQALLAHHDHSRAASRTALGRFEG